MFHILPKLKVSRTYSNRCIPGTSRGNNWFFWSVKYWSWYCHRNIEDGLSSKRYNEAARRFHGVFKNETAFSWCLWALSHIRQSYITNAPHSYSALVFESSYFKGSPEQNSEKELNDLLIWFSILCLI